MRDEREKIIKKERIEAVKCKIKVGKYKLDDVKDARKKKKKKKKKKKAGRKGAERKLRWSF